MLFNSIDFLIFFPVVTALYFILPQRFRWLLLLAASCYFYMAFIPVFILILAFTITVDYFAGIGIERAHDTRRRQILLASIIANVGVLFVFKYFNFFNANIAGLAEFLHWNYSLEALSLILPIGLSFHTFQSLSYTIEVYRGVQKAERNLGIFALYVMFYPQLVAGPIERPQNLLHQFKEKHSWEWERVGSGLSLMLFGFFKKIVIADNLAPFVNQVYGNTGEYLAPSFVIATVFFAFQIYCDFSGYSDIAIGAARVMGISLMKNFNMPYLSRSIKEFWRRWHISLSTWFKDYVFIPLGGSRASSVLTARNLLITFTVSGLWHGANWTYVVWGALNGVYLVVEDWLDRASPRLVLSATLERLRKLGATILTFILITITWVFFRASDIASAWHILTTMFTGWGGISRRFSEAGFVEQYVYMGRSPNDFYLGAYAIIGLLIVEYCIERGIMHTKLFTRGSLLSFFLRWFLIATAILLIIVYGQTDSQQFIYFQF